MLGLGHIEIQHADLVLELGVYNEEDEQDGEDIEHRYDGDALPACRAMIDFHTQRELWLASRSVKHWLMRAARRSMARSKQLSAMVPGTAMARPKIVV